ncbi:protein kinase-like domain, Phloem protein 2-like protein [Artemisia annua]|uniref:Protein kinase-like domain, Phloem protein 2-like protein n=1 Tax=Artemisia annua TaxID=35608 RepID=A0A2U1QP68_ARTAN|nr:protein kinase-like domain, Phloem protein 2-like protein [Artemisia annua]
MEFDRELLPDDLVVEPWVRIAVGNEEEIRDEREVLFFRLTRNSAIVIIDLTVSKSGMGPCACACGWCRGLNEVEDLETFKGTILEYLKIDLHDIRIATNNFHEEFIFTSSGFHQVYVAALDVCDIKNISEIEGKNKSELPKRSATVAIKRYPATHEEELFIAEIETIASCKHPNVVSLLGFCDDHPEKIIVYEYASKGTLGDYLGGHMCTRFIAKFTWVQRLKICIEVAHGLNYIHTSLEDKQTIIHRNIKSHNILLNKNLEAMIDGSPLCIFLQEIFLNGQIVGSPGYLDPEYRRTGRLSKEVDIYSFGVVLFEICCWRLANDPIYDKGLAHMARKCFKERTLHEMVDPYLKEEANGKFSIKAVDQDSLETFLQIAYQCLQETRDERPTMETVIKELEKALHFQENKDNFQISLDEIKLATRNFSHPIGKGGFGQVYRGEVTHKIGRKIIAAKRLDRKSGQGETQLMTELEILLEYKHENVIGLVGYCDEKGEKIIVYEYATRGSLDRWLKHNDLKWRRRLEICIDIATGLDFLHGTSDVKQEVVIHRDIKAANILLHGNWKAKIADFGLSLISPINQEMNYVIDNAKGTYGYCDPQYITTSMLTKESDIYSFGVLLFEILCGRFVMEYNNSKDRNLVNDVRRHYEEGRLDEMVFEAMKKQIVHESLTTYIDIAYECTHEEIESRPTASKVLIQLMKALDFQEDHEIWEPKLPRDYKKLIEISNSPELDSAVSNKDIYDMLFKGILLHEGSVFFSLGTRGERNEIISATRFSYKNRRSHKWASIPESRFQKVAEIFDVSNLKIQIKIKSHFLSPGVNYGVYLIFKFCGPRKISSTPMYVNLKYKMGKETLHSYFATWRDNECVVINVLSRQVIK